MNQENLQADMISLFQETAEYAKKFHKKTYASDMDILLNRHGALLGRIREAFEVSDEALAKTASVIPDYAAEQLAAVPSKRKRDLACLDFNMNMVSFFVPLLGEISSVKTKEFTEKMIELYNERMPDNKIGHSTREQIQGGFKKGLCYITTAVCRSLDKPDDCYELTLLRNYRDQYLLESKEGMETVNEYYNIAPTIVKRIDRQEDSASIYAGIWQDYLRPCVRLIEEGKKKECQMLYSDMVRKLERKYLYS
ncbi:Uncharacterised protein [[Eubacterium] contortum]|uniref:Uncharacterized protein n=1 Tax=Faecalicatena contorta TaxID=39482 RepID=A0A174G7V1_9FIRM|nr:CFI-box-CTERM domain-containing protein [Faecalicatena contorta]CUO56959.1 Uncharacterised protein [[Eubacterium] contortum] [Faecalicatena contorta]